MYKILHILEIYSFKRSISLHSITMYNLNISFKNKFKLYNCNFYA